MTEGIWTATDATVAALLSGTFLPGDTYKVALLTGASNIGASSTAFSGVTGEVAEANTGYTAGGVPVGVTALTGASTTGVPWALSAPAVWTAGSAGLTARWAVLYEVGGDVLAYTALSLDATSTPPTPVDVTATQGNTFTLNNANPIFTATWATS